MPTLTCVSCGETIEVPKSCKDSPFATAALACRFVTPQPDDPPPAFFQAIETSLPSLSALPILCERSSTGAD
jgi:hypothetical protein